MFLYENKIKFNYGKQIRGGRRKIFDFKDTIIFTSNETGEMFYLIGKRLKNVTEYLEKEYDIEYSFVYCTDTIKDFRLEFHNKKLLLKYLLKFS